MATNRFLVTFQSYLTFCKLHMILTIVPDSLQISYGLDHVDKFYLKLLEIRKNASI